MKVFKINNINIAKHRQREFNVEISNDIVPRRSKKFLIQYRLCDNVTKMNVFGKLL